MLSSLNMSIVFILALLCAVNIKHVYSNAEEACSIDGQGKRVCSKLPKGANREGKPQEVSLNECNDRSQVCVGNAERGECEKNPGIYNIYIFTHHIRSMIFLCIFYSYDFGI